MCQWIRVNTEREIFLKLNESKLKNKGSKREEIGVHAFTKESRFPC
jgi:hypothetical protein